jgi:hypothetical protein
VRTSHQKRFRIVVGSDLLVARPLSMIGRGVPAGNTKAAQEVTMKSFTPASPIVGTSAIVGQRCAEVTASERNFPELIVGK